MANRPPNTPLDDGFNYVAAAIRQRDIVYVSAVSPRMQADQLPFAVLYDHDQEEFALIGTLRWNCVSLCAAVHPLPQMIALGAYGQVKVFGSEQDFEERVIPEDLEFREVRTIGGMAYACAMDRKVYRREGVRNWTPLHADMPARPAPDFVFGFESIHGFGPDDLYAVRWVGTARSGTSTVKAGNRRPAPRTCCSPVCTARPTATCMPAAWVARC